MFNCATRIFAGSLLLSAAFSASANYPMITSEDYQNGMSVAQARYQSRDVDGLIKFLEREVHPSIQDRAAHYLGQLGALKALVSGRLLLKSGLRFKI
jgi:hypothetical protein